MSTMSFISVAFISIPDDCMGFNIIIQFDFFRCGVTGFSPCYVYHPFTIRVIGFDNFGYFFDNILIITGDGCYNSNVEEFIFSFYLFNSLMVNTAFSYAPLTPLIFSCVSLFPSSETSILNGTLDFHLVFYGFYPISKMIQNRMLVSGIYELYSFL